MNKIFRRSIFAFAFVFTLLTFAFSSLSTALAARDEDYYTNDNKPVSVPIMRGESSFKRKVEGTGASVSIKYCYIATDDEVFEDVRHELFRSLRAYSTDLKNEAFNHHDELFELAEHMAQGHESTPIELFYENNVEVRRADTRVLSLLQTDTVYRGGGSSTETVKGVSFNVVTGERLSLSDVCDNIPGMLVTVRETLLERYSRSELFELEPIFKALEKENAASLEWTIENQMLVVHFNPGQIMGEEHGVISIPVPFKVRDDLFYNRYTIAPNEYGVDFVGRIEYSLFDNHRSNLIEVGAVPSAGGKNRPIIVIDGTVVYENSFECESLKPYLLKTQDDVLLCLDVKDENDNFLAFYSLKNNSLRHVGVLPSTMPAVFGFANEYTMKSVLTEPNRMLLDTVIRPLSTCKGRREYELGKIGLPVRKDVRYEILAPFFKLTLKKPLAVTKIDEKGNSLGTITLSEGTVLRAVATDDMSYVDMQADDGTLCRIDAKLDSWPHTVGGEAENNVFDGIHYSF